MTETTIFASYVLPLKNPEVFRLAYNSVSLDRKKKIDGYRFEKDRLLSLGAEILLQYALKKSSPDFESVSVKISETKKPYLENSDLHFNISHSGEWVICAISDCEVGCDIEKIDTPSMEIAEQFFCPEEYSDIKKTVSEKERNLLFYRYWTLKESFVKATGLGLSLPFNSFLIELKNQIRINQKVDDNKYSFFEFNEISGYCCSLCSASEKTKAELKIVNPFSIL